MRQRNGGGQLYYLGIGLLWDKDTGHSRRNYSVVVREVGFLRETGRLPWEWITDCTRMIRQETQYDSLDDAMHHNTESYRRNLWASQPRRVEVWCESDSVGGVLLPVTSAWGVGLYSCRGQSSKTFVYEAVQQYAHQGKGMTVIYCGDWDPTGRCVPRSVVERMARYGNGELDLEFRQIAITADDVRSGRLTTHDVNTRDVNFAGYREECMHERLDPHTAVEVEALRRPDHEAPPGRRAGAKPMSIAITAGQRSDSSQFEPVLKKVHVARPLHITVETTALDGTTATTVYERGLGRLIAHEIDHLDGLLYLNRMRLGVEPISVEQYRQTGLICSCQASVQVGAVGQYQGHEARGFSETKQGACR